MTKILELRSVDELLSLQQQFPGALVLVYVYKADVDPSVISGRAERAYRSVASSVQGGNFQRPIIFTRHEVDADRSLRDYASVSSVPMILYFLNGTVVRRLEDITDTSVWKYLTRHGNPLAQ